MPTPLTSSPTSTHITRAPPAVSSGSEALGVMYVACADLPEGNKCSCAAGDDNPF
ncbi:hypothetical protein [Actinomadura formosensis]|uniref:hypothetical protein n=1 Tax=Actinomadura formosensis TaxID=60706 RepID=UPI0013F17D12|nr:hypothetical protein [Actinomadura formosensis]